jgi:H/ACA ribonucleoprotein complex subunit 4
MKTKDAFPEERVREVLCDFRGKIHQRPPEMSAVAKNIRIRQIYQIEMLEYDGNFILFRALCQHGTYIRKLVEDIGLVLGTKTEMLELRRTRSGPFVESEAVTLTQLQDAVALQKEKPELLAAMIRPTEYAIQRFAKAEVNDNSVKNIQNGAGIYRAGILSISGHVVKGSPVAILNNRKLIAVGEAMFDKNEILAKTKGEVIKTAKVLK